MQIIVYWLTLPIDKRSLISGDSLSSENLNLLFDWFPSVNIPNRESLHFFFLTDFSLLNHQLH